MSGAPADTDLITLMSELQSYVRQHLEQPEVLAEIRHWMTQTPAARYGSSPRVATAELVRAFELLAPALMVDFLNENSALINQSELRRWAAERENLNEVVMNMIA